jgi:hypothetical protein
MGIMGVDGNGGNGGNGGNDGNGWEMMAMRTIRKEWERMGGTSLNLFCFFRSKIEMGRGWCDAPPIVFVA